MLRIDTHHHVIPPDYRNALQQAGLLEAGGRALPDWSPETALQAMADLDVGTAILSVSTPGTAFLPNPADATALARDLNDYAADLAAAQPDRFGFFATVPLPHIDESVTEVVRALDGLHADGVVLLANNAGTYLGEDGQDPLFAALNDRSAVVFIHPAELPGPSVPGIPPFAADFLLDTTRAAYLLVSNGILARYPNIRFILSHAGGFVPYASHRTGRHYRYRHRPQPRRHPRRLRRLLLRHRAVIQPGRVADPAGLRQTGPRHVRVRLAVCPDRRRKAVRGGTGDLSGYRRGHPHRRSSVPTRWRCSPGSALRRNRFRSHLRSASATSSADRSCAVSAG